jgi:hypothetical protein
MVPNSTTDDEVENMLGSYPEMPTIPGRGYSGNRIKAFVIRAMSEQMQAEQRASKGLDELIELLKRSSQYPPPPAGKSPQQKSGVHS